MDIKGKIAVITGASRGIGKEIALAFCREGATVALCDINAAQLEATAAELAKEGLTAAPFALDVASFSGTEETMKKIVDNFGRVDILINNAGITKDNLMLRMKENEWDAVINVNLKGTFNCIKSVSKYMLKQKSGKIVNSRHNGKCGAGKLFGFQGRDYRAHQVLREGICVSRH